jgi:hypothetical protein
MDHGRVSFENASANLAKKSSLGGSDRTGTTMMRTIYLQTLLTLTMLLGTVTVFAQDADDEMEATMRLMGKAEAELPDAVTKPIKLPDSLLTRDPDSAAIENSADGHKAATVAREHREEGLIKADEARERATEMTDNAKEDRENHGRSEDHPTPPENPGPPGNN